MLTKTKIDSSVSSGSLHQLGYDLNRCNRTAHGGGVVTYIRESLQPKTLFDLHKKYNDKEIEITIDIIEAKGSLRNAVILGVYRPPNSKVSWFSIFKDLILETLLWGSPIIMGDLNSDLLKPLVYPAKPYSRFYSLPVHR